MNLYVIVLQEVIRLLEKKIGIKETKKVFNKIVLKTNLDINLINGKIKCSKNISNEDNFLHIFNNLKNILNKKIGIKNTKELLMAASKQVLKS